MEETEELKRIGFVGYRLKDGLYSMVDFETGDVLDTMNEVSVLYDGTILLKHGSPDRIDWRLKLLRDMYNSNDIPHKLHVITGKIPIDELDKILALTDYLPKEVKEYLTE
jgi:hypothetical protein